MTSEQVVNDSFVAGLSVPSYPEDAATLLQMARADGYDFCTTTLPNFIVNKNKPGKGRRDVTSLESKWWSTSIVGEVVLNKEEEEKEEKIINEKDSDMVVEEETAVPKSAFVRELNLDSNLVENGFSSSISWACHMNIPAVVLPPVSTDTIVSLNYARMIKSLALKCSANNVQLWVRTFFSWESLEGFELLCRRCDTQSNLGCLLCFNENFSSVEDSMSLLHRFIGNNLKSVSFNTCIFLTNKRGYPTLSKSYQMLFTELLKRLGRTLRVLVEGGCRHHPPNTQEANGVTGCLAYLQYLRHLRTREEVTKVLDTEESCLEMQYLDHLQTPLQPLGDDLEFSTYEVFEKDDIKYRNYQLAIELAIKDKFQKEEGKCSMNIENSKDCLTIFVLGAGRGPLIRHSLLACESFNLSSEKKINPQIIAIEKNPSAVLYLESLKIEKKWDDNMVTIIESDMRYLMNHPFFSGKKAMADIIVSELLGSFGDNELSPECLDGAQRSGLLKNDCICIPQKYTSFIAPVSSMRLYSEARLQSFSPFKSTDGTGGLTNGMQRALETSYVVRSHASSQTHVEKECFVFEHPKLCLEKDNNERFCYMEFQQEDCCGAGFGSGYGSTNEFFTEKNNTQGILLHGFLGTFNSCLYNSPQNATKQNISIAPNSFSVGMFSWFPLYFPLKEPLFVPLGATIRVAFWRKADSTKVWYEWCAEVFVKGEVISVNSIHNPNGRSSFVRL